MPPLTRKCSVQMKAMSRKSTMQRRALAVSASAMKAMAAVLELKNLDRDMADEEGKLFEEDELTAAEDAIRAVQTYAEERLMEDI